MCAESHVLGVSIFSVDLTVDYKFKRLYTDNAAAYNTLRIYSTQAIRRVRYSLLYYVLVHNHTSHTCIYDVTTYLVIDLCHILQVTVKIKGD